MRVAVLTAMRDVAPFVKPFFKQISLFTHRPMRLYILENDSLDSTSSEIYENLLDSDVVEVQVNFLYTGVPRFERAATSDRSAHLALVRNHLIDIAMRDKDWDFALMLDAQKFLEPGGIAKLLSRNGDIVAPYCTMPDGRFYDTWCFRDINGTPFSNNPTHEPEYEQVSAVGGVYLIKRAVLEAGCRLAGTDGSSCDSVPLCNQARERGFGVFVDRSVTCISCLDPDSYSNQLSNFT